MTADYNSHNHQNYQHKSHESYVKMSELEQEIKENNQHYFSVLTLAIIGIFLYYLSSILLIGYQFPHKEISWKLAFSNTQQLGQNIFYMFFGYFIEYFNLYKDQPSYLLPVDIITKSTIVIYFHLFWMNWDTKKSLEKGYFNSFYPYLKNFWFASNNKKPNSKISLRRSQQQAILADTDMINSSQRLANLQKQQPNPGNPKSIEDDDDDKEDDKLEWLPFHNIHKPLGEFYYENEIRIYGFIRRHILPGSNLLIVLYYSTLFIVDFKQPLNLIIYTIAVASMFWCMQTFLLVLDHNQYPPEEEIEIFSLKTF